MPAQKTWRFFAKFEFCMMLTPQNCNLKNTKIHSKTRIKHGIFLLHVSFTCQHYKIAMLKTRQKSFLHTLGLLGLWKTTTATILFFFSTINLIPVFLIFECVEDFVTGRIIIIRTRGVLFVWDVRKGCPLFSPLFLSLKMAPFPSRTAQHLFLARQE